MTEEAAFELGTDGPKVIVVGVDGSHTSLNAASYAWGLARRNDATLIVVHVGTAPPLAPGAAGIARETGALIADELRGELEKAAQEAAVRYVFVDEQGDAATVLARIADERKADAVIVGASTKAGHRLIGSVAVRLVKTGRWPVTVVP